MRLNHGLNRLLAEPGWLLVPRDVSMPTQHVDSASKSVTCIYGLKLRGLNSDLLKRGLKRRNENVRHNQEMGNIETKELTRCFCS